MTLRETVSVQACDFVSVAVILPVRYIVDSRMKDFVTRLKSVRSPKHFFILAFWGSADGRHYIPP
jgi:hypothetical protein